MAITLATVVACNVYTPDLLTGDGGTGSGATGGGGDAGETGASGGEAGVSSSLGGSSGNGGSGGSGAAGGSSGACGGSGASGGSGGASGSGGDSAGTGGSNLGGTAGTAGTTGGTAGTTGGSAGTSGEGGAGETGAGGDGSDCSNPDDCCPNDPNKTEPGLCGCGVAETDTDGDLTPNCLDGCPSDPNKVGSGECGCGYPDIVDGCLGLRDAIIHRYSFDGSGDTANDTVGDADGEIVNTTITGTGSLVLAGVTSDQYVKLPEGLVSTLTDATFEVWTTWSGGNQWQRIFDFGSSTNGPGMQGTGETYLFLTPSANPSSNGTRTLRAIFTTDGTSGETIAAASAALPTAAISHIAVVFDDTNNELALYLNGVSVASATSFTGRLSTLIDENVWLGRSNYSADNEYGGSLHEFRIYDAALNAAQIQTSFASGPDATFF